MPPLTRDTHYDDLRQRAGHCTPDTYPVALALIDIAESLAAIREALQGKYVRTPDDQRPPAASLLGAMQTCRCDDHGPGANALSADLEDGAK